MEKVYNFTEQQVKEYAEESAKSVVIYSFENDHHNNIRRKATKAESYLVERAIAAALLAIRSGYDEDSAKATAEFFVLYNTGKTHVNTNDSVYVPIKDFLAAWE